MVDQKCMMHLSQMTVKLRSALQVDLEELDVFFIYPSINPSDPLIGYGYFGAAIKNGKNTSNSDKSTCSAEHSFAFICERCIIYFWSTISSLQLCANRRADECPVMRA